MTNKKESGENPDGNFKKMMDGEIIDTTQIEVPVWCTNCGEECQEEAIIKGGRPYHYNCSGIEL